MRSLASLPNNFNDVNKKNDTKEEEQPLTMGGKVKKMWKNYGNFFLIAIIINVIIIIRCSSYWYVFLYIRINIKFYFYKFRL